MILAEDDPAGPTYHVRADLAASDLVVDNHCGGDVWLRCVREQRGLAGTQEPGGDADSEISTIKVKLRLSQERALAV